MACYHPNIIITTKNGITKKNGEKGYKVTFIGNWVENYEEYLELAKNFKGTDKKYLLAPCGTCQGCRTQRRLEWATRIELESRNYPNSYFITLTYDNEHLPIPDHIETANGERIENPGWWMGTLVRKDAQNFVNSLKKYFNRKYNHKGMKYYIVGEYGSSKTGTHRPHYHAILINCPEIEKTATGKNKLNQTYYNNERIQHIWGKGFITIGKVTTQSINYVAGYVNKKIYGKKAKEEYLKAGKIPEFALMSKSLGRNWLEEHILDIYKNDEIILSNGKVVKPPQYFDRLLKENYPDIYEKIKEKRENISAYETEKKIKTISNNLKAQYAVAEMYAESAQTGFNRNRI